MAEKQTSNTTTSASSSSAPSTSSSRGEMSSPRQDTSLSRRPNWWSHESPSGWMSRFADEMDRIFDDFGFGRGSLAPRSGRSWPSLWGRTDQSMAFWAPQIEMFQRGDQLVIHADLPGMTKDDVQVDVRDNGIRIHGERKHEHEEEHEGLYRSERSYGSFERWVAVPEGAMTDQAKAEYKNGVLEITMPAPPEHVTRGRRLEIK